MNTVINPKVAIDLCEHFSLLFLEENLHTLDCFVKYHQSLKIFAILNKTHIRLTKDLVDRVSVKMLSIAWMFLHVKNDLVQSQDLRSVFLQNMSGERIDNLNHIGLIRVLLHIGLFFDLEMKLLCFGDFG